MGLNAFSLEGKIALITGGGTGIGLGITQAMVEAGAKVVITGRREDQLKNTKQKLGMNVHYFVHDIQNRLTIPALIDTIESSVGAIDILVNNAGVHLKKEALNTNDEEFENILQTNLISVFSLTRECAKKMAVRKHGSVIFIGSMAGNFGVDRVVAYGTSKAALTGLMYNLVTEYSKLNIRLNIIAPGWIESPMFLNAINADEERKKKIVNRIAMNGFGTTEDIGNTAVFLSSEAAKYITGVVLSVDGGATVNF